MEDIAMTDTQDAQDAQETQATNDASASPDAANGSGAAPATMVADEVTPPLAALMASIRAAISRGASPEARAAGATACRSILTVLEAKPGQPLAVAPYSANAPTSPVAALLSQPGFLAKLAAMSREQLLELLQQITAIAPSRTPTPATAAPRFHLIQIPQARRPGGS
jgi:hypothetical protein